MRRTERFADAVEQFRSAFEGMQSDLWTSIQGTITAVDFDTCSCTVQPTTMAQFTDQNGVKSWQELPLLLDVPLCFPSGGGFVLTFPVAAGDEVLVVFASRSLDNWWAQTGDVGPSGLSHSQAELRMHDLSDGVAIPGLFNKSRVPNEISPTDVQLRSTEGSSFYSIQPNGNCVVETDAKVQVFAESDVDVTSTSGNVVVVATAGNITATATAGAITATAGTNITATAAEQVILSAGTSATIAGDVSISVTSPLITLTGTVNIIGSLELNGVPFGLTHKHTGGTLTGGLTGTVV